MAVKPIPDGYRTVTPYLTIQGVREALAFLQKVFDAKVVEKHEMPDGKVGHAAVRIGDSMVMLGEANEQWKAMPGSVYLYIPDVDAAYRRGLEAGGKSLMPPADQFYGDRQGGFSDPAGNYWWVATHVEDVPPDEMERRAQEWTKKQQ